MFRTMSSNFSSEIPRSLAPLVLGFLSALMRKSSASPFPAVREENPRCGVRSTSSASFRTRNNSSLENAGDAMTATDSEPCFSIVSQRRKATEERVVSHDSATGLPFLRPTGVRSLASFAFLYSSLPGSHIQVWLTSSFRRG